MDGWAERGAGGRSRRVVGRGGSWGSHRRKREFRWAFVLRALRAVLRVPFVPPHPRPPGRARSARHVGGRPSSCGGPGARPNSCGGPGGRPSSYGGPGGRQRKEVAGGCHRTFRSGAKSRRMLDESGMSFAIAASGLWGPSPAPGFTADELQNLLCAYAGYVLSMMPLVPDSTAYTKTIRGRPVQVLPVSVWSTMHRRASCFCGFSGGRAGGMPDRTCMVHYHRPSPVPVTPGGSHGKHAEPCAGSFRHPARHSYHMRRWCSDTKTR